MRVFGKGKLSRGAGVLIYPLYEFGPCRFDALGGRVGRAPAYGNQQVFTLTRLQSRRARAGPHLYLLDAFCRWGPGSACADTTRYYTRVSILPGLSAQLPAFGKAILVTLPLADHRGRGVG